MTTATSTTGTVQATRCLGCGRPLTSASSIASRRGPVCHARVIAAASTARLDGYKPEAIDKAADLIEQAAIVPTSRPGLYTTVSSDGISRGMSAYPTWFRGRTCRRQPFAIWCALHRGQRPCGGGCAARDTRTPLLHRC